MLQGVDTQLKILQTLVSLVTNFPTIHSRLALANVRAFVRIVLCFLFSSLTDGLALLPRFRLHESRTPVVSSTAVATLHQWVMFVVDKFVEEKRPQDELESITLPDAATQALGPAARDASGRVTVELCLLGNGEQPQSLRVPPQDIYTRADRERTR